MVLALANEVLTQRRGPTKCQGQGRKQRDTDGYRESAKEYPGDTGGRDQRYEHDNRRNGRKD